MADFSKIIQRGLTAAQSIGESAERGAAALPKVDRLSMSYKDVTKRVPEVAEAFEKLNRGEITKTQYNDIVNTFKPVTPYSFVPMPASREEAIGALRGEAAKSRYGMQSEYEPGSKVGLRLDIPAYTDKGVWVNSIHDEKAKKVAYGPVASVKNANMGISQAESKRIAQGGSKAPYARIKGEWNPMSEEEAVAKAQRYLNDPEWRQIGMDPERHSYFYDRATMQPVTGADEVIQIGPLVLGKNPKYGKIEDFEYAGGGTIVKGLNAIRKAFQDAMPAAAREAEEQGKLREVDVFGNGSRIDRYDDKKGLMYSAQRFPNNRTRWTVFETFPEKEGGNQVLGEMFKYNTLQEAQAAIKGLRISATQKAKNAAKYGAIPNLWEGEEKKVAKALIDAGLGIDRFGSSSQSRSKYIYLDSGLKVRLADHALPSAYDLPDFDYRYGGDINALIKEIKNSDIGNRGTYDINDPDITKRRGGPVRMQVGGLTALARLGKAGTKLTPAEQAALRARGLGVPGIDFADPLNPKDIMRMSEALGASGSEGKTLNITQADRSRVFGPNKGGTGFSGLQLTSEPHQQAGSVWGVGKPSHATRLINANDPNTVWSTFIGAPTQHMSNPVTVERMYQAHKAASPSSELIGKMNDMLNSAVNPKTGKRVFPDGIDISDPSALSQAKTFDQRKLLAQAMTMGGEKKGEKATQEAFKIIKEETDPLLTDAPTYAVGNRLFTIDQNTGIHRPDLNVAFPHQVTGTDLGLLFEPAPIELAMPEFAARFEGRLNKAGKPQPLGHKDLTATTPRQFVSEEYLTNLQKEGYKEGGNVKSFSQRLAEGLHMAIGGGVTNMSDTRPDITDGGQQIAAPFYAKGGPIKINFKGLRGRKPKRFEDGGPAAVDPFAIPMENDAGFEHTRRVLNEAGKALAEQYEREKKTLSTAKGRRDVAGRVALQLAGSGPDLLNLAAKGVDLLQEQVPFLREPVSVMDDPKYRAPAPYLTPDIQYKPKFTLSSEKPWGGSEMLIEHAKQAGLIGENEAPMTELLGNIVGGGALAKVPKLAKPAAGLLGSATRSLAPKAADMAESYLLNSGLALPILRGSPSKYLSAAQILEVNKGRGLLSKKERQGLFDENSIYDKSQQLGELQKINNEIAVLKKQRQENALYQDPLLLHAHQRPMILSDAPVVNEIVNNGGTVAQGYESALRNKQNRFYAEKRAAEEIKKQSALAKYFDTPIAQSWNKKFSNDISQSINNGFDAENDARLATLEAITREARKLGWKVDYASKGANGRLSSRYIDVPGKGVVRISDHELPVTPQREFNHSQGLTGRWVDEIVLDDWRYTSLQDYINRIALKE